MEGAQHDHQEDHLEEGDEDVAWGEVEAEHTQDGGGRRLGDGQAEREHAVAKPEKRGQFVIRRRRVFAWRTDALAPSRDSGQKCMTRGRINFATLY